MAEPKEIYADRVQGRTAIYLDVNAWSDLTEAATDEARDAREAALVARSRGLVVFPLAYAVITELLIRDVNADSMAQADLMDTLSNGVAFRGNAHIRDVEVMAAWEFMLSGRAPSTVGDVFTITPCYLSDTRVVFPAGWTEEGADEFMDKLQQHGSPGMRWLQQHMRQPHYLASNAAIDERYVSEISRKRAGAAVWAADQSGKLNAKKIRFEEHTYVLNKYILTHVTRFLDAPPCLHRLQTDGKALKKVVESMPSTWLSCEINVQRALETSRRTRKQDFYDHEHAVLAVPYTHAFVTQDGGILDVLRKARATERFPCQLLRGVTELRGYLSKILGE